MNNMFVTYEVDKTGVLITSINEDNTYTFDVHIELTNEQKEFIEATLKDRGNDITNIQHPNFAKLKYSISK